MSLLAVELWLLVLALGELLGLRHHHCLRVLLSMLLQFHCRRRHHSQAQKRMLEDMVLRFLQQQDLRTEQEALVVWLLVRKMVMKNSRVATKSCFP